MSNTTSRIDSIASNKLFQNLEKANRDFIEEKADEFFLSHQDLMNVVTIVTDLEMWDSGLLEKHWDESKLEKVQGKKRKQIVLARLHEAWENLKTSMPDYKGCSTPKDREKIIFKTKKSEDEVLGICPVFSEKTRCCNLMTLDAVMNCGFGCSYCSIQSFYHGDEIVFHEDFSEKLAKIKLEPDKLYHIGTGQSSDSLLWGNRRNILGDLFKFAEQNQNVILEMKSKSANIGYLLENPLPKNVMFTWSLNAESIVKHEELKTASLDKRIESARQLSDKGSLVGFHLHPIVMFDDWEKEYGSLVEKLLNDFKPEEVGVVSLGTLTFIKPVMKQLRERKAKSKILQMPFEDAAGKSSYPMETKVKFFKHIYNLFKPWHGKVFFYLCMEDPALWPEVFGFDYASNAEFEDDMKQSYYRKIQNL